MQLIHLKLKTFSLSTAFDDIATETLTDSVDIETIGVDELKVKIYLRDIEFNDDGSAMFISVLM